MMGAATELALEDDLEAATEEPAKVASDRALELAAEHDVETTTDVRLGGPTRANLHGADDFAAVVIGSHGGSPTDRLFVGNVARIGNVAGKVFRRSPSR